MGAMGKMDDFIEGKCPLWGPFKEEEEGVKNVHRALLSADGLEGRF